jgi:hypothetical protein
MAQSPQIGKHPRTGSRNRARRLAGIRVFACLLAGVLAVSAGDVRAQGGADVFKVSGVEVDATAETVAKARDRALPEGQRKALNRLFDRIILAADRPRLGPVPYAAMTQLVRDFQVRSEKTSSVRYLAVLDVRFKPDAVRDLLRSRNVGFAETRSRPVLVLPVYESAGAYSLWGTPNPWRDVWAALPQADGLVPLLRPRGDVNDVAIISAEQAVRGDAQRIAAIARQYGAAEALVVIAGFRQGAAGEAGQPGQSDLQVTMRRLGVAAAPAVRSESFALRAGEDENSALARAAGVIASQIQEEWKQNNRLQFGASRELTATVPISSLSDWLGIKRRLGDVAFIRESDLLYLSRNEAWLRIRYLGNEEQLTLALRQKNIALERGPTSWILRRAGRRGTLAPRPGPAPAPVGGGAKVAPVPPTPPSIGGSGRNGAGRPTVPPPGAAGNPAPGPAPSIPPPPNASGLP